LAIVIIGAIAGYFLVKKPFVASVPPALAPAYNYYISCVEGIAKTGADIMASQGGYLELPEFKAGTTYAPFSSELGFMGLSVPYWYYISGNGIEKEQIPTKIQMQNQLAEYIQKEISKCSFQSFENQGYNFSQGLASIKTVIGDSSISVLLNQKITINYQDSSFIGNSHTITVDSRLGNYYETAKKIYDYEKSSLFLENYTMDVLYNYAPVEGVLSNCSPAVWNPYDVIGNLKKALEENMKLIKLPGDYYTSKGSSYFIAGKGSDISINGKQVSFVYSGNWPSRFEVWPTANNLMMAKPIGMQTGLGIMGFCYIPYKFVYDIYIPVLVQIYNPENALELFEFPIAVVINKNVPKTSIPSEAITNPESICDKANSELQVNTYDVNLNPVEADITFKCVEDSCSLGKTKIDNSTGIASLITKAPQCFNGYLEVKSGGYNDKKQLISTNEENIANIVLDRSYNLNLEVYVDGVITNNMAVLSLSTLNNGSQESAESLAYPSNKEIKLSEGDYQFDLMIYGSGSISLPATTSRQCVQVPKSGLLGVFGAQDEKCFDVTNPAQTITNVLNAGGILSQYITPSELENAKILRIYARGVEKPTSLESMQSSYDSVRAQKLEIELI
jgi:hypothetical protein